MVEYVLRHDEMLSLIDEQGFTCSGTVICSTVHGGLRARHSDVLNGRQWFTCLAW
ncbi:uncharacterized protein G2W53_018753 [Senna tora]|uniref:Uncharacterized protein n=1 Tax=Senna tora TaxID=362788 RepID=A0A834TTN8_9FABA|nr:uncharacterized protein G2W53_018753 [Senna tora]